MTGATHLFKHFPNFKGPLGTPILKLDFQCSISGVKKKRKQPEMIFTEIQLSKKNKDYF